MADSGEQKAVADTKNESLNPLYMATTRGSIHEHLAQEVAQSERLSDRSPDSSGSESPSKRPPLQRGNHPPIVGTPTKQPQHVHTVTAQVHAASHLAPVHGLKQQPPLQANQPLPQRNQPPTLLQQQHVTPVAVQEPTVKQQVQPKASTLPPPKNVHQTIAPSQVKEELSPSDMPSGDGMSSNTSTLDKNCRVLHKSLSRSVTEDRPAEIICPRVNCPEKIIICLDVSQEMEKITFRSRAGDRFSPIKLVKRALGIFMNTKNKLDARHEYALMYLRDQALWMCDFTNDPSKILTILDDHDGTFHADNFDMSSVFNEVASHVRLPRVPDPHVFPPPYIVRVLFIYGRSHCMPYFSSQETQKQLNLSPHFFLDAYYIHEPPSDENLCEAIFDLMCGLDEDGLSYIFEVSRNPTKLYDAMAMLLPHPLQRPPQSEASYSLEPRVVEAGQN